MKSSLKKLRGLATHNHRSDFKDNRDRHHNVAQFDELVQAFQDMQDMRNCYDSLLNAAATTANSAYEFSEALREMGACLLEKTAMNDDEESGRVLLMLGKKQFELQKLVDGYRSHVMQTISIPSESLGNELRTVEVMKKKCDDKRSRIDHMLATQKEKSKSKSTKNETFSLHQIQAALEEYEEEATLFIFRLKSLKQGQSRSLLTQAARHHAAQLTLFSKGHKCLEAIEPYVKSVAEQQHIDYQFSGLDEDGTEDDDSGYDPTDDGELNFDYGQNEKNEQNQEVSTSRNSMELDQMDHSSAPVTTPETSQEDVDKTQGDSFFLNKAARLGSMSAPIFPEKKFDPAEKLEMHPSLTRKSCTYVLPTPLDCKGLCSSSGSVAVSRLKSTGGIPAQSWHSSPLVPDKILDDSNNLQNTFYAQAAQPLKAQSVLKESNINSDVRIPPPLAESFSLPRYDKKVKRQAFSGPLTSKGWSGKPFFPIPQDYTPKGSTLPIHVPTSKPSISPKVSPPPSPPIVSSPKISELHELPRPPINFARPTRPPSLIGHSAPLVKGAEFSSTTKALSISSHVASPLPIPPISMTRSFSIPSRGYKLASLVIGRSFGTHNSGVVEEVLSPALNSPRRAPSFSDSDGQAAKLKG